MDPITISNTPETPAVTTPPAAAAVDNSAELTALRAEVAENKRSTEFWYSKATTQASAPPAPVVEAEPEAEIDMLDLLATQGVKGLDKLMKSRGYASKAEVEAAVNSKAAQLSTEAELLEAHPSLRDRNSEFFKQTAQNYGELKRLGVPEALAMKLGAQKAQLDGFKSGKTKAPTTAAEDKEASRLARVKAQSGDRNARAAATLDEDDDDEITPQELHICEAMGITPEAYKARAQKGVQMGMKNMPVRTTKKAA
jgi:hypothetical protein